MHSHHSHHAHVHENKLPTHHFSFFLAVLLNAGFVVFEVVYAFKANSMSLLADAGHNLGDVLGLIFSWAATWLYARSATERFSYGFKRTTILAALTNALILVATSAVITFEAINRFLSSAPVHEQTVIFVALIGIFINASTALLFLRGRNQDLNIKSAFLHLAYDALISLGVVLTGILIYYTNWEWLDPMLAILIVVAILFGTWGLLRDSVHLILDGVPQKVDQQAVKAFLGSFSGVIGIHDLHIWGLSTNDIALTAHLIMPEGELSDADYQQINHELRDRFHINHVTLQVERGTTPNVCGQLIIC